LANSPGIACTSKTQFGWVIGSGLEYAFLANWSAKIEYLYADLGKVGGGLRRADRRDPQNEHCARRSELQILTRCQ
jgi:opacity protein-like surface antigen